MLISTFSELSLFSLFSSFSLIIFIESLLYENSFIMAYLSPFIFKLSPNPIIFLFTFKKLDTNNIKGTIIMIGFISTF